MEYWIVNSADLRACWSRSTRGGSRRWRRRCSGRGRRRCGGGTRCRAWDALRVIYGCGLVSTGQLFNRAGEIIQSFCFAQTLPETQVVAPLLRGWLSLISGRHKYCAYIPADTTTLCPHLGLSHHSKHQTRYSSDEREGLHVLLSRGVPIGSFKRPARYMTYYRKNSG